MPAQARPVAGGAEGIVEVINPQGTSDVLLVCEHASSFIPPEFNDLGLDAEARVGHIAWDPGALGVARIMSAAFDATLVAQRVSRLVYDCNRPPESPASVPEVSEKYTVPGNAGLTPAERQARAERFYYPFRDTVAGLIEARIAAGRPPVIVTIHSFTPVFLGIRRAVEIGILHDADDRLANAIFAAGAQASGYLVRRNDPYGPTDGVTHTLIEQALSRRLLNVMIEVRNDLIAGAAGQQNLGNLLDGWVTAALADPGLSAGVGVDLPMEKARHA